MIRHQGIHARRSLSSGPPKAGPVGGLALASIRASTLVVAGCALMLALAAPVDARCCCRGSGHAWLDHWHNNFGRPVAMPDDHW